jgi:Tfp pilus assembly protein PilE
MKNGLSLMETVVIVATLAILSAIFLPVYSQSRQADKEREATIQMREQAFASRTFVSDVDSQ